MISHSIRQEKTVGKNGYIKNFQYLFWNVTLSMKQPNFCSLFCNVSEKLELISPILRYHIIRNNVEPFQRYYVLREIWDAHRRTDDIYIYFIYKWRIVSLDKTLIHRLVLFTALWSCTETVILSFNRLESIETNYGYKSWNVFIKNLNCFRLKKEKHKPLGWHGGE